MLEIAIVFSTREKFSGYSHFPKRVVQQLLPLLTIKPSIIAVVFS
jgi:hypothetical protein